MNQSDPAKLGIAFAAGIAVALAGAIVYVKTAGVRPHEVESAPVVSLAGQPETLGAGKLETPRSAPAPALKTYPAETAQQGEPVAPPAAIRHAQPKPLVRANHPRHARRSLPESQSTIRVEVSQMTPSTVPATAPAPVPSAAAPVVRTVNEDQAQMPYQAPAAPRYTPPTPPPQPHTVTLQPGTSLIVRLGETVSTEHNFSGDTFRATLERPVILEGFVIAEKGSKVLGKIVGADKAGKFQGTANLQLTLTEINTTDGQRVRVETGFLNKQGPSNVKQEAEKIGGGAVLGAIIGAIAGGAKGAAIGAGAGGAAGTGAVLLSKSKPAVIPSETQLTFQLSSPTTITERIN